MNTTFTTCAEKKAKQFLNLLQGYTKGIRMTAILILLLMGVSNAWGAQYNMNWQGKVYFLVPEKWDLNTYNYVQVDITRTQSNTNSNHQEYVGNMTRIGDNSRLYYLNLNANHNGWNQNEYLAFTANDHTYRSGTFALNGNVLRTQPIDYGCNNSSNFYLFKPNSESNFNTTTNDNTMSGDWNSKRDDLLLKKQTIDLYSDNAKSNTGGTVKMTGYYFTSNTEIASSSATSSSSSVYYNAVIGTEMKLIATPKAGYSFVGWYNGETQLSTNATYSYCIYDTKTIKAKFKENTYSLTVEAGEGIASVTGSTDPVTLNSTHPITATLKAGYTFSTWTADPSANATFENASSANTNVTVKNGAVTVTATATENTHDVAVSYKYGTTTIKDNTTTNNVGEVTSTTITAPDIYGYTFKSWELGTGITQESVNGNSIKITTKSSGEYTLTAKYDEDLTTNWALAHTINNFSTISHKFTKNTGESAGNVAYVSIDLAANTHYEFKVHNGNWYGNNNSEEQYWIKQTVENWTFEEGNNFGNCHMKSSVAGTYTFKIDFSDTKKPKVSVYFPTAYTVTYGIHSSGGGNLTATANGAAITSGTYVKENQTIVFTAKPEQGYQVEGWYSDANCTAKLGNGYSISNENNICTIQNLTKTETVYVKFKENTFDVTVTVNNAKGGTTEPSGLQSQIGQVTGMNIAANVNSGYQFIGWDFEHGAGAFGAANAASTTFKPSQESTIRANFEPNTYTITYNDLHGVTHSNPPTYTIESETITFTAPTSTRTGYTFAGWDPTQIAQGSTGNQTVCAQWTANTYTVTLDQTGAAKEGSTTSVDANFEGNMPAITGEGALPTPQIGYTFMGYFDQEGTQYYKADGTSERPWDKTEDATLYAYFKKAEITNITLDKEVFEPISSGEADVTATPTIDPSDIEGVVVCWRLLYSNGDEVDGHPASPAGDNKVKFSIVGLATGTYTIEATLHATACGNGEPLSTLTKNFIIASEYTVTVKYTCDNQEIKASTTAPAQATETTDITAPDIFGYTFKEWTLGDGVSSESTLTDKTISYTAIYDGTITAKYTKKKLIYLDLSQKFSESGKWSSPYIYLYGSDGCWDNDKGAGATGSACVAKGAMTKIEGTDIWYYDYSNVAGFTKYLAFTWGNHTNAENFHSCDVIYRGDFSEGTPLFVPATDQTKEEKNGAKYYSKGYWVNYIGEHTGYTLIIYNQEGNKELIRQKFTSANKRMDMTSVIDLEAEHKYQYEVLRDHGYYYKYNSSELTNINRGPKPLNTADKGTIITTAAGDYTFTLGYKSGDLQISVDYPAAVGDYRILYRDNGEENWSGNTRPQNWCHPSRIIKKKKDAKDIISFFINHDKGPRLQYQTITDIDAATGKITWSNAQDIRVNWSQIGTSGVYNFTFTQQNNQFELDENIEPYTGNYYIRVDAVDGKWGNYKTDPDNRMTYSAFSESDANSFGELFSHYKTKWCPRETNVKFTIANDYSPCITDTLIRDITKTWDENMDDGGKLYTDKSQDPTADKYSANIRFMWNRNTNKISRAYISSATNVTKKFLILQGNDKMKDAEGKEIAATEHVPADATLLDDKQNWIYETTIKVQPGARVKLYACYATPAGKDDIATAQYFRGTNAAFSNASTVQILGGTGETWNTMRVIYDFKTNRLMGAWVPDTEIGDNGLQIDADIMIMREHQEEATCINLTENANSKLTDVKTVYGVMRFNRWILNNRANPKDLDVNHCSTFDGKDRNYDEEKVKEYHPVLPLIEQKSIYERSLYFISFPFDVNLSDVFGFGTYWNEWYIEYYDGLKRAREGFFIDSPPNWKYVTPEMADTFKLHAYQGYILGLDLDYMQYDNTSFWAHNMQEVELFFPSTTTMGEIAKTEVTMPALGPEYECKINRPNSDHRVIDSYWRCIGVPSYANYDGLLYAGKNGPEITWKTDRTWTGNYTEFPFLYSWNTTDNTITPRSTREFKFKAMHSYLVQNKSEIYWKAVNVTPSPAAIMAREMEETRREYEWRITLTKGEKEQDQTFIRLTNHEQVTTEFDFNQDLSKEFNYGRSDIYTLIGNTKAAANSLPITETTTLIPLGLSIEFNGDYTIAMPDRMENIGVTLIDTESNTRTNLSAGMEYVVTLNKGDYNNRFFIEISPAHQVPTDIEYVTGDSNNQDSVRKVLIDNILYIVRDGQMFDARGARVK